MVSAVDSFFKSLSLSLLLFFPLSGVRCCRNFFTVSSESLFHPPLHPVFFFQSSSIPAFLTSPLTQFSHLSLDLPRLLLPCSRNSAALFGSLSSAILSTCLPTVVCSSHVSRSSSSALPGLSLLQHHGSKQLFRQNTALCKSWYARVIFVFTTWLSALGKYSHTAM